MESYRDQERLLWEQLSGLVTDAAWLESYAAAAMLKVKETMQVGVFACECVSVPREAGQGGRGWQLGGWVPSLFLAAMLQVKETMGGVFVHGRQGRRTDGSLASGCCLSR
jgi:hypothetical protein